MIYITYFVNFVIAVALTLSVGYNKAGSEKTSYFVMAVFQGMVSLFFYYLFRVPMAISLFSFAAAGLFNGFLLLMRGNYFGLLMLVVGVVVVAWAILTAVYLVGVAAGLAGALVGFALVREVDT